MLQRLLPLLALTAAPALAQTTTQVAFESFDYAVGGVGGNNGGSGWFGDWWAGTSESDGIVVAGSVDAVGNQFNTSEQWAGSFRKIDTIPHTAVAPNGKFGSVDSTMWIRFWCQKPAFSTDTYGGMFLHDSDLGARVFLGAPGLSTEWGVQQSNNYANTVTAPGTSIDVVSQLVVRIDHVAGGTTVSMWVNPGVPYPATQPDCAAIVDDFQWNYIWLASGNNGGGATGYLFDEIVIEREGTGGGGGNAIGTNYCTSNAQPNSSGVPARISAIGSTSASVNFLTLEMTDLPLNQFCLFVAAQNQGLVVGPGGSQGVLCLSGALARFGPVVGYPLQNSGTTGSVSQNIDISNIPLNPPVGIAAGETWYFQGWYRDNNPTPTSNFSDGIQITYQ
jgi:hypothetical protein